MKRRVLKRSLHYAKQELSIIENSPLQYGGETRVELIRFINHITKELHHE